MWDNTRMQVGAHPACRIKVTLNYGSQQLRLTATRGRPECWFTFLKPLLVIEPGILGCIMHFHILHKTSQPAENRISRVGQEPLGVAKQLSEPLVQVFGFDSQQK